jgi:hypothetical protein
MFLAATAAIIVSGCNSHADHSGKDISPEFGYQYSDTLVGTVQKACEPDQVGEKITFIGLTTPNPTIAFSGTGTTSPMTILGESEDYITLQLFTGHSTDTFCIQKKTGLFSRAYTGNITGPYAGASVGSCK